MSLPAFNFKNLSIRRKQMLIIMLTSSVALLLASIAFVTYDILNFRRELVEQASTTAEMIGNNCVASLEFNDPKSAGEILAASRAEPNILAACVYDREGNLFSTYTRDGTDAINEFPTAKPEGHEFVGKKMWLFKPIIAGGKTVGTVSLAYDLKELNASIVRIAGIVTVVLIVSLFIAFVISSRLQRFVSIPILHLAKMTHAVAVDKNYSVRAVKSPDTGQDELGKLIDGFNEMLAQIQTRDIELQKSREMLEGRVKERTAKLEESFSLLNATLESTGDGILVLNQQGKTTSYNTKFAQMWRVPREIIESGNDDNMIEYVAGQLKDEDAFVRRIRELYANPAMEGLDILEFKDGRVFERYSQPQRLGDSIVGRVWCFRDVTDRVRAEDGVREKQTQLAEARNFLEKIINSISEPIFVKDRRHRGVLVNDAYCQFSGRSREQEIGSSDHDYFPKQEADAFQLRDEEVFNSGVENVSEEKFTAANGEIRTIITKKNLYTDEKRDAFIVGVIQDITERKRTENALRESQALYHSLVDQMPAGMYRKNRIGQFVFVNSWFCELKKTNPNHILGRTASEMAASEMKNPTLKWRSELAVLGNSHHELIMQTGEMTEVEEEYCDEAGKKQYLRVVRSPVYDSGGNITGTQGMIFDITASKEAEAALQQERNLLRTLIDHIPDYIYVRDISNRFVVANESFARLMGVTGPSALIGKRDADFYPPSTAADFDEIDHGVFAGCPHFNREAVILFPNGQELVTLNTKVPFKNDKGEVIGLIGIGRDITERKRVEAELDNERNLLRMMLDNSPDLIYFKDAQSRFLKSSKAMAETFGLKSADELIGKTDFDFFAAEHARPAFEDEQEIIRTGCPLVGKMEKEVLADGHERWVLTTKMPFRNKDGVIIGTFGISKDITVIKQAEAELAYQRDLLETLMNHSPDSIFFKDIRSRFVKISRSEVKNLLRVSLGQYRASHSSDGDESLPPHFRSLEDFGKHVIGNTDADIYGVARAESFGEDEKQIMRTGKPIVGKIEETVCPDGSSIWFLTTKVPWFDKDGNIIGTFGTARDITDLKNTEAKLEVMHKQLLETSRQAGMAEVASNVLHNVGNVLNSVNVSASVVSDSVRKSKVSSLVKVVDLLTEHEGDLGKFFESDPRGKQLMTFLPQLTEHFLKHQNAVIEELESLRSNIDHIKEIVAMQQNYANVSGVKEIINIRDLVEDSLRLNFGALSRHGVEIIREYADVPPINIDKHKVLQILVNLLRNAKHACQDSERTDKRLIVRITNEGDRIKISVIDNGVGIPPENLTRIFSHGFTTKKNGHGFGLHSGALAARELGGSLNVHSDGPGKGANFTLYLPVTPESVIKVVEK